MGRPYSGFLPCGAYHRACRAATFNVASLAVDFVAFSFIGVEVVGVTAYEASDLKDLRRPSKTLGYIVLLMYLVHSFSTIMVVRWDDPRLGIISNDVGQPTPVSTDQSLPILNIAALNANDTGLSEAFTGMLIYSTWSAANISLYIASRTLYGIARAMSHRSRFWRCLRKEYGTGVPAWSVNFSAVLFWWIPLAQLARMEAANSVSQTLRSEALVANRASKYRSLKLWM